MSLVACPPYNHSRFPPILLDQDAGQGRSAPSYQDSGQGEETSVRACQVPNRGRVGHLLILVATS